PRAPPSFPTRRSSDLLPLRPALITQVEVVHAQRPQEYRQHSSDDRVAGAGAHGIKAVGAVVRIAGDRGGRGEAVVAVAGVAAMAALGAMHSRGESGQPLVLGLVLGLVRVPRLVRSGICLQIVVEVAVLVGDG